MSKYDFGYELEYGSTNEWAFHEVQRNSDVLELGSSVGNLTSHLVQEKGCLVDIVEIDEEAGDKAQQFAELALIGEKGDLNGRVWMDELLKRNRRYDYIVILDVLEHLLHPENTLESAKMLLKSTGKILLSIPNVAHNSVLINAFHNKFEYTQLGLLDCTHIHFFAYEDMIRMLERLKLKVYVLDAVTKAVGTNEIENSYHSLPAALEYFFRTRKYAEVYQYLIVAGTEEKKMISRLSTGISDRSLYPSIILINGLGKNEIVVKGTLDSIDIKINLQNYDDVHDIRFLPVEQQCVVRDLTAYGRIENQLVRVSPNWTGGIQVGEKDFIFAEDNYEINFCIHENFDAFFIKCRCILLDTASAEMFMGIKEAAASKEKEFEADQRKLLDENQELLSNNQYLQAENDELKENKQQVQAENQRLKEEQQKLYLENEKLKAHNVELDDRNQSLYSNQRNLKAQIEQLEAAVREYRKLWYVKWKEWIHR